MCIPKITHHRCKLFEVYKQFDDGADYFAISKDIYPDLFLLRYPHIVKKAPGNRFLEKHGKSTKYLWFPSETLSPKEIEEIRGWAERFKRYVLLNEGKLAKHYSSELDFCMALDFNYDENHTRTPVGELVYNIKYQHKNGDHLKELVKMVETGISDLPLQGFSKESIVITCVPGESTEKLPHKIVEKLKASKKWDCRPCTITEGKKPKSKEPFTTVVVTPQLYKEVMDADETRQAMAARGVLPITPPASKSLLLLIITTTPSIS